MAVTQTKKRGLRRGRFLVCILVLAVCLIIGLVFAKSAAQRIRYTLYPKQYAELVEKYAEIYSLDENLIYAVIKTESGFDPQAVSANDAKGLMQITPDTFDWIGTKIGADPGIPHDNLLSDPELAVQYGSFLLCYLIDEFEDYRVALSAYHAGRGAVSGWLKNAEYSDDGKTLSVIPYADTDHYVGKVMKNYEAYTALYGGIAAEK